MPACRCPVHDLQWGIPICRSAHDALMTERRLDVVARFDRYGEASLFCLACAAKVDVVLAAEAWATIGWGSSGPTIGWQSAWRVRAPGHPTRSGVRHTGC